MNAHTRRAVAYIAGRLVSGDASSVYDYEEGSHAFFSGDVSPSGVSIYDYDQGCHVGGSPPSLYHYGNGQHLNVEVQESSFTGYDYDSGQYFTGNVSGGSVSLYDYEQGRHYNYTVS